MSFVCHIYDVNICLFYVILGEGGCRCVQGGDAYMVYYNIF